MVNQTLIEKKLPQDLRKTASTYTIADEFLEDAPDLIELVLRSRSIDTIEEKQNWFNLLPLMNALQMEKLKGILVKEKDKLAQIEEKYEDKKQDIKKKYLQKRQEAGYIKQITATKEKETKEKEQDSEDADALLSSL